MPEFPHLQQENELSSKGYEVIAGIDEAGRGALAGPVVAAAVVLPRFAGLSWLKSVRDSKELSPVKRESLFYLICGEATAVGVGIVPPQLIDFVNILNATKIAMQKAVQQLALSPDYLLIDYLTLPQLPVPQRGIVRGDKLCLSIACASIIAKVTRDHIMIELDRLYPSYGLARHKGYGTRDHFSCLNQIGPSPIHRYSFAPIIESAMVEWE